MSARGWRQRLCITQKEPWSLAVEYIFDNRLDAVFYTCRERKLPCFSDVKNLGVTFAGRMTILKL